MNMVVTVSVKLKRLMTEVRETETCNNLRCYCQTQVGVVT